MRHRTIDRKITARIPRSDLAALLGRAQRVEERRDEAPASEAAPTVRPPPPSESPESEDGVVAPPTIVHHASIQAWLASKR